MLVSTNNYIERNDAMPVTTVFNRRDYHIVWFFLNVAAVIIGYGLAVITGKASLMPMRILRIVILMISLIYLFSSKKNYHYFFKGQFSWIIWVFMALNMYVLPFSANISTSFEKLVNLIPYFIYLNYFIVYLNRMYDKQYILNLILNFLNIVYIIPVVSFVLFGGSLSEDDIYGETVGGFISNHYGWGSVIFLATSIDILRNDSTISKKRKIFTVLCCVLACYILAISGSRSGYLTFCLCFLLFILRNRNTSFLLKIISVLVCAYVVIQLYGNENSALSKRITKTETQLEKGDARNDVYELGFQTVYNNPSTLITGLGFYTFAEAVMSLNKDITVNDIKISLHNSYYELLFGSGVVIFVFFMIFFVFKTIFYFFIYHSSRYVFLPPLVLIPFFENNFNPGQFLFFPWFIIMLFYIHFEEKQIKLNRKQSSVKDTGVHVLV